MTRTVAQTYKTRTAALRKAAAENAWCDKVGTDGTVEVEARTENGRKVYDVVWVSN